MRRGFSCISATVVIITALLMIYHQSYVRTFVKYHISGESNKSKIRDFNPNWYARLKNQEISRNNKTSITIFTRFRSGSTLIGELFNRHPNVFYIFEPYALNWNGWQETAFQNKLVDILQQLNDCNFHELVNESLSHPKNTEESVKQWAPWVFCRNPRPSYLAKDFETCTMKKSKSIGKVVKKAENFCRLHSRVVTKMIRVLNITTFTPYLLQGNKVISLRRDPRGIISSRVKLKRKHYFQNMTARLT